MCKTVQQLSEEARLMSLFNDALNMAHEQIKNGTASSQVLTTVIKWGAEYSKNQLELAKLAADTKLSEAKVEAISESTNSSMLLNKIINDIYRYRGEENPDEQEQTDGKIVF